jgi:Flp pilus assembly pilin Flp
MADQDLTFLINARDQASAAFENVKKSSGSATQLIEKHWKKVAVAGAALGGAIEAITRKQAGMMEQTRKLSASLNMTEEETQDLALSMSNVTFPLEDVLDLMETGRQQGIKSAEQLKSYAEFWDMVGDATGEAGPRLAEASAGLRAVGIAAGEEQEALAAFGYITEETTGSVNDLLKFLERSGPELREMGMGVDEAAAIMGALEHELGMTARTARTEFRSAVAEAEGDMSVLMETLGLTEDQLGDYMNKIQESSGVIERNADIHAESYTIMQKVQHRLSELTYEYGAVFEAASAFTPALIALGPALKAAAMAKNVAAVAARGLGVAIRFAMGPVGLIITAIGLLVVAGIWLYKNWDEVSEKLKQIWSGVSSFLKGVWDNIVGFFKDNWDKILAILFPAVGIPVLIARNWGAIVDIVKGIWEKVVDVMKAPINAIIGMINNVINAIETMVNAIGRGINAIPSFDIPSWVPGIGGKSFGLPDIPTVTLPRVPTMDTGGVIEGPGLFHVGPGVKEVVREPGAGVTINMYDTVVREEADIERIAIDLERRLRRSYA